MGDTPLGATSWADAGHRVGRLLREALDVGHAFLVISEPTGHYVQLHAHPGGCWVEDEDPPTDNYGFDVEAPVDVYRLVLLLVRTFSDAYGARPEGLGYLAPSCHCEQR